MSRRAFSTTIARRNDEPPKTAEETAKNEAESSQSEAVSATNSEQDPLQQEDDQQSAATGSEHTDAAAMDGIATKTPMATKRIDNLGTQILAEETMDRLLKEKGMSSLGSWVENVNAKNFPPVKDRNFAKEMDEIIEPKQDPRSYFFDETDPDQDSEDFEEFNEDDMTEMAHAKLHEIQEMRQYQRLAVWELPLLSSEQSLLFC